jgi:hypothetical protein
MLPRYRPERYEVLSSYPRRDVSPATFSLLVSFADVSSPAERPRLQLQPGGAQAVPAGPALPNPHFANPRQFTNTARYSLLTQCSAVRGAVQCSAVQCVVQGDQARRSLSAQFGANDTIAAVQDPGLRCGVQCSHCSHCSHCSAPASDTMHYIIWLKSC